jgi:hypothetical protein
MEDALSQPLTVAEIDENDAAVIASGIHPTDESDSLANVGLAEFVAMMSAHGKKFKG